MLKRLTFTLSAMLMLAPISSAAAQDNAELAEKLSNPIASMISMPFQFNYDDQIGPERDGDRFQLNIQPVVPIPLSEDWTMISRTIMPVIDQDDIFPGAGSQFGYADGQARRAFLFVPAQAIVAKWIDSFKEFPPRAKAAGFTVSDVMDKITVAAPELTKRLGRAAVRAPARPAPVGVASGWHGHHG